MKETGKHAGSTAQSPRSVSPVVTNPQTVTDSPNGESDSNALRARPSALNGRERYFFLFQFHVRYLGLNFNV